MGGSKFPRLEREKILWVWATKLNYLIIKMIIEKIHIGGLNVRLGISYFTKRNVQMSEEDRWTREPELRKKRHTETKRKQ